MRGMSDGKNLDGYSKFDNPLRTFFHQHTLNVMLYKGIRVRQNHHNVIF